MNINLKSIPSFHNTGTIFRKELRSYFNSAVAYVVIVVFLAIVGWFHASNLFVANVASLRLLFELVPIIFLFVVPAITMRLLAEEKKAGTIELLTTKPLEDWELVLGKFFAAWALIGFMLLPTLLYYITVTMLGTVDHGPIIGGYLWIVVDGRSLCRNRVIRIQHYG